MQQRLRFIRVCKGIVTSPSDMELWAREINHFSWFWCTQENLCDCISLCNSNYLRISPEDVTYVYKIHIHTCTTPKWIIASFPGPAQLERGYASDTCTTVEEWPTSTSQISLCTDFLMRKKIVFCKVNSNSSECRHPSQRLHISFP